MKQITKIVSNNISKNRREGKGRVLALSSKAKKVYRVSEDMDGYTDTLYKVESETSDNQYYLVRYETFGIGLSLGLKWCTCPDFGNSKNEKCKHIFAVEYAIKFKTVKVVE